MTEPKKPSAQALDALPPRARLQLAAAWQAAEFCIARALRTSKTAVRDERQFWDEVEDLQKGKAEGEAP